MTLKNNNTASVSSVPNETIIGYDTKFRGAIETDKPLTIEGYFEGEIKSSTFVLVAACGTIDATIECSKMKMLGKGKGQIKCSEELEIGPNGEFVGDVTTKNIITTSGSKIDGQCKIG